MAAGIRVDGPGGVGKHAPALSSVQKGHYLGQVIQQTEVNLRVIGGVPPNLREHRLHNFLIAERLVIEAKLAVNVHNALRKPLIPDDGEDLGKAVNDIDDRVRIIDTSTQCAGSNLRQVPGGKTRVVS